VLSYKRSAPARTQVTVSKVNENSNAIICQVLQPRVSRLLNRRMQAIMSVNIEYAELISQHSGLKRGSCDSSVSVIRSFASYFRRSPTANLPTLALVAYARAGEWGRCRFPPQSPSPNRNRFEFSIPPNEGSMVKLLKTSYSCHAGCTATRVLACGGS
jgi:hypothetical protein